ncbi:MAG: hypothetical protein A2X86_09750 [Bdellovibrionales bacterium GWA2_49_15]|nr:MAG: hypothetical protein A2X86_09750 [Bdellovibrionales bacterium GWA2_49_15]HAZ13066.1 hypothetical protein [Bdellovibrionales bacterium]
MFRNLYLIIVFSTGALALIYQILWQHLTSLLLGSDARASTLVVATFLLGLSAGYYCFGILSTRVKTRANFLKLYGWAEILIGVYAFFFPNLFHFFFESWPGSTETFLGQILVAGILYIPPTFLMGATVPVMTSVLPEAYSEVNSIHTKVYGLNTLGALVGVILGPVIIMPFFGALNGLRLVGVVNVLVAVFYLFNRLTGNIEKSASENGNLKAGELAPWFYYVMAFSSGFSLLGLEIIWFRLWALTIGSSYIIFPMVVALFVGALGVSGITLKKYTDHSLVLSLVFGVLFLSFSYTVVPFLPLWTSNIRVLMMSHPINFPIYYLICFALLIVCLFPGIFFAGRLLPLSYALSKKNGANYGRICALIYFCNTLGTFTGAIVLGHLLMESLSIVWLYRSAIGLLVILTVYLFVKIPSSKFLRGGILLALIVSGTHLFQNWNRVFHAAGTFRDRTLRTYNFQGPFSLPTLEAVFFEDGASATVAVTKGISDDDLSIQVNGKSDSNTIGDYSTIVLTAVIPYLKVSTEAPMNGLVIGLGTGVTAGILGQFSDIARVDIVEISPKVVKANTHFAAANYHVLENPKVHLHEIDAFKFLKKSGPSYEIVISEPTNPWTVGVENLFTSYFYQKISDRLAPEGIFVQWLQTYAMSPPLLGSILRNLHEYFPHTRIYRTHLGDWAILASKTNNFGKKFIARARDPQVQAALYGCNLPSIDAIDFLEDFTAVESLYLASTLNGPAHDIFKPTLARHAFREFFLETSIHHQSLIDPYVARHFPFDIGYIATRRGLMELMAKREMGPFACERRPILRGVFTNLPCLYRMIFQAKNDWDHGRDVKERLSSYAMLRHGKFLEKANLNFLYKDILKIENKFEKMEVLVKYLQELLKDGSYEEYEQILQDAFKRQILVIDQVKYWQDKMSEIRPKQSAVKLGAYPKTL